MHTDIEDVSLKQQYLNWLIPKQVDCSQKYYLPTGLKALKCHQKNVRNGFYKTGPRNVKSLDENVNRCRVKTNVGWLLVIFFSLSSVSQSSEI